MDILILGLALKILIPVVIFYMIMKLWYRSTAKRTNFSDSHLSFSDWYHVVFDKEGFGTEKVEDEIYDNEDDQILVSDLPHKHREMCVTLGLGKYISRNLLKKHYRRLVFQYHPDRMPQDDIEQIRTATKRLILIKEAHDVLVKNYFKSG